MTKPLRRVLVDENDSAIIPVDDVSSSLITIDYGHHEIHEGDHFYNKEIDDLGNAEVLDLLIITPDTTKYVHLVLILSTEAEASLQVYVAPSISANGTAMSTFNRDGNSSKVATLKMYKAPTVVNPGTLVAAFKTGSGKSSGGTTRSNNEVILRRNTKYLARITNNTTSNNWIDWLADWYEHVNSA